MISQNYVEHWAKQVPWQTLAMVEQDLIISRALVDLFSQEKISLDFDQAFDYVQTHIIDALPI